MRWGSSACPKGLNGERDSESCMFNSFVVVVVLCSVSTFLPLFAPFF